MVASCMIKILKTTAPEHIFQKKLLEEALQFIVSSFASLSRNRLSTQSYQKFVLNLQAVAEDKIWNIMLNMGFHDLIRGMFYHFMGLIRDDGSDDVFQSVLKIMTGVLKKSDGIPRELLIPILAMLRKNMKDFQPLAQKLGVSVSQNCRTKLKPYLKALVEDSSISLDDYCEIVTTICNGSDGEGHDDDNASGVQMEETSYTMKGKMLEGRCTSTIATLKPFKDNDPRESSKRKRTLGNNKVSGDEEYGKDLVGAKVKVWWNFVDEGGSNGRFESKTENS